MDQTEASGSTSLPPSSQAATVQIRELSMDNQLKLIERLFSRLQSMYGQQFLAMWERTDLAEVKDLWADKLGFYTPLQIGAALDLTIENKFPPNLPEFVAICAQAAKARPRPQQNELEITPLSRDEAEKFMQVAKAKVSVTEGADPRDWARKIIIRHEAGEQIQAKVLRLAKESYSASKGDENASTSA